MAAHQSRDEVRSGRGTMGGGEAREAITAGRRDGECGKRKRGLCERGADVLVVVTVRVGVGVGVGVVGVEGVEGVEGGRGRRGGGGLK